MEFSWQPFDTAPKNGNQILVWREDAGTFIASYGWIGHLSRSGEGGFDSDGKATGHCWFSDGEDLSDDLPVFWMPLPADPDDRKPLVLDVPVLEEATELNYDDAIKIARGCFDYSGGHRDGERKIFHHGIQTVCQALEGTKKNGLSDLQSAFLHSLGSKTEGGVS